MICSPGSSHLCLKKLAKYHQIHQQLRLETLQIKAKWNLKASPSSSKTPFTPVFKWGSMHPGGGKGQSHIARFWQNQTQKPEKKNCSYWVNCNRDYFGTGVSSWGLQSQLLQIAGRPWASHLATLGLCPLAELIRDCLQCEVALAGAQGRKHLGYLFFSFVASLLPWRRSPQFWKSCAGVLNLLN